MRQANLLKQNFSRIWHDAVGGGFIATQLDPLREDYRIEVEQGDQLTLPKGCRIRVGLNLKAGKPEFYAENIATGEVIHGKTRERAVGACGFMAQLNPYRTLRSGGSPGDHQTGWVIAQSPGRAGCRFWCSDAENPCSHPNSLLLRQPLMKLSLPGGEWVGYHNQAPIEKAGHLILLPARYEKRHIALPHFEQRMTSGFLGDMLALFRESSGVMLFFNSMHAGATVDHIHFQVVAHQGKLPIEKAGVCLQDGHTLLSGYPAQGFVFQKGVTSGVLYAYVERLQQHGHAFNLLLLGDRIYLIPRRREVVKLFVNGWLASMELAGKFIFGDPLQFHQIDETMISRALADGTFTREQLTKTLSSSEGAPPRV